MHRRNPVLTTVPDPVLVPFPVHIALPVLPILSVLRTGH